VDRFRHYGFGHAEISRQFNLSSARRWLLDALLCLRDPAQHYEQLAGGSDPQRQRDHDAVANEYLAACREKQEVPTIPGLEQAIFSALPVRTPRDPKRKVTHNTVFERPEPRTISMVTTTESETRIVPFYRVPSTYGEGVEAAAELLDDSAKKQTSPEARALVERLAQRVRQELVPPKAQL
jgi:hypothetical protein